MKLVVPTTRCKSTQKRRDGIVFLFYFSKKLGRLSHLPCFNDLDPRSRRGQRRLVHRGSFLWFAWPSKYSRLLREEAEAVRIKASSAREPQRREGTILTPHIGFDRFRWEIANQFHLVNSVALAVLPPSLPKLALNTGGVLLATGMACFSGSIYAKVYTGKVR